MSLFKDMLQSDQTLFQNELALDYAFVPKILPHREQQQRYVAKCIHPLLMGKTGRNVFVYGAPGIGKTVAIQHVLNDMEHETDEVIPIYINCWKKNTSFKIIAEICHELDYKLTHNKRTEELFAVVKNTLNKKAAVFVFDEVDKLEDFDFLYGLIEEIYKKTIVLITNYKDWIDDLDDRVRSRLIPDLLEFKPYNLSETADILKQRMKYAFYEDVWDKDAFEAVAKRTAEAEDIRLGLNLMREIGNIAEAKSSRKITLGFATEAINKMDTFAIKKAADLTDDEKSILDIVKEHSGKKIGELYIIYKEKGGRQVYKTFQRRIDRLAKNRFISVKKIMGGKDGTTTIVKFGNQTKKLTEF